MSTKTKAISEDGAHIFEDSIEADGQGGVIGAPNHKSKPSDVSIPGAPQPELPPDFEFPEDDDD